MNVTLHSSGNLYSQQSQTLSSQPQIGNTANEKVVATDKVLDTLADKIPGVSGTELKQLKAEEFTPDKVSGRIADFVAKGLEQARRDGKSEAEVQALYEDALRGIEQGFSEAKDILKDMNLLSADIESTIDETYQLTLDKLGALAPTADASPTSTSISAAERYQSAESFSLKVKTQDGDKVSIHFAATQHYESSLGYYNDGEGTSAAAFSIDRSQNSNYMFSVKGNLDAAEIDALQNLIQDMSLIADDFFDGDIQAAFEQANEFQMDKTELASMHLTLKRSEQYTAATAYQQIQGLEQPFNNGGGRKLGHLINNLHEQFAQPQLQFIDSIREFGQSLFEQLVEQDSRYRDSDSQQQQSYDNNLSTLRELLDTAEAAEPEEAI